MTQQQLTPQQALQVLYQATAKVPLVREEHVLVNAAIEVLQAAIKPQENPTAQETNVQPKGD